MTPLYWVVAVVALQRMGEVVYARRNTARLLAEGGIEWDAKFYPVIVALHAAWLLAILVAVPSDRPVDWTMLALYGALQAARYWTIASLGRYWTTRVIVLPEARAVRRGPYRFTRHPNYAVVAGEIAVLPLVFGAWRIAVLFTLLNALVLAHRIRIEDHARRAHD